MFGSEAMKKHVYNVVRVLPTMAGIPIVPKQVAPPAEDAPFPMLLHYAEQAPYRQDPINRDILPSAQTITYVLRFVDQREDDGRIRQARRDAFEALVRDNAYATVTTEDNETFTVSILAGSEWTIATDSYDQAGRPFVQRGFSLICDVDRVA